MKSTGAPTMKDVAHEAGVSLGTVSKVINGIPVGEAYRIRVEEATKKLGYQINNYARGLKTNKTYSVALILPYLKHPFFAALADEVTVSLMKRGYRTVLMTTFHDSEVEKKCISMVRQNKIDGIIALTYNPELVVEDDIPFVTIDRHCNSNVPCVSSDNFGGGQMAAEKLIELGCEHLLFFRIGSVVPGEADKRGAGFENMCRLRGVDYHSIILTDEDTEAPFFTYLEEHVKDGKPDFDGLFCNTDRLAKIIMDKLISLGVRVPDDVQIIGYDGMVDYTTGQLFCSTIVQPLGQMAEAAVDILLSPDKSAIPALMSLPVKYVSHGTTRD